MDSFKNFAKVTVSTGYDASATSIVLSGGHGAKLPTAPFNATWWNSTDYADPTDDPNVEIVRVTAIVTDTLTVTRGQESISATTKNTASKTYKMIAGLTAKTLNTDISAGGIVAQTVNGRLTLQSGVAVSTTDQTAKTTIYFTPYQGNRIALFDGSAWAGISFTELSLALGTLVIDKNYDVFVWNNAGTLTLELGAAWTSDIARADAISLQDGVYVKSGATTRRYLGTFRTTTATTTEDSLLKRFVWNRANSMGRDVYFTDAVMHTYDGAVRMWANSPDSRIQFVSGLAEEVIGINVSAEMTAATAGYFIIAGIGLDGLTPYRTLETYVQSNASGLSTKSSATEAMAPQLGYHALNLLQRTFSGPGDFKSGTISAIVRC